MSFGRRELIHEERVNRERAEQAATARRGKQLVMQRLAEQFPELPASQLLALVEGRYDTNSSPGRAKAS